VRILIGYEGSKSAAEAIADLRRAGVPDDAEALVVTVRDTAWSPPVSVYELLEPESVDPEAVPPGDRAVSLPAGAAEADAAAAEAARCVRASFPGWTVRSEGLAGDPADVLMRRADEWGADVVVVGSRGRSAFGRMLLGSVSRKLVTSSPRSVRVVRVPTAGGAGAGARILIGLDASPESEFAVRAVAGRSWPAGTEVRVLTVDESVRPTTISPLLATASATITASNNEASARQRMAAVRAVEALHAAGLSASAVAARGEARRALVEQARDWAADSIFVGSGGFASAFERFRLGSVSVALAERAPCAVEVVRPDEAIRRAA
jgi:nucleotide-binding universal stress UspA family protein